MKKYIVIFILFIAFVIGLLFWLVYPELSNLTKRDTLSKVKNSHQWVVTIKDPKFHILQIPQPVEYQYEVKANGKTEIRTLKCTGFLITSFPWAYAKLESNPNKHSGTFKRDLKIELRAVKGYSGFILWIDGVKVAETSLNHLEYNYIER